LFANPVPDISHVKLEAWHVFSEDGGATNEKWRKAE